MIFIQILKLKDYTDWIQQGITYRILRYLYYFMRKVFSLETKSKYLTRGLIM